MNTAKQFDSVRDLVPIMQELQITHHCNQCGASLPKGGRAVCAVVSVSKGSLLSSHRIAWCKTCWDKVPPSLR